MAVSGRFRGMLIRHEGLRLKPYKCSAGKLTIGVGRNIEDIGITEAEAMHLLENDIERVLAEVIENFPWFDELNSARQDVILDMCFNMGTLKVKGFRKMINAITRKEWGLAAVEMLDSAWAKQVGFRAQELAIMMRLGQY